MGKQCINGRRQFRGDVMGTRGAVLLIGFFVAAQAVQAAEMNPEQARRFIVGETFTISCVDGTRGAGRVNADGSVMGTLRFRGAGPLRSVSLPPGTLKVKGEAVCAALKTVPFEPCFNLNRTSDDSFRGWVSGFEFAYCDFTRLERGRTNIEGTGSRDPGAPLSLDPCAAALHHVRQC
jgi:hypothetical protein